MDNFDCSWCNFHNEVSEQEPDMFERFTELICQNCGKVSFHLNLKEAELNVMTTLPREYLMIEPPAHQNQ